MKTFMYCLTALTILLVVLCCGCATRQPAVGKIWTGYEDQLGPCDKISMPHAGMQLVWPVGQREPVPVLFDGSKWVVMAKR